MTPDAIDEYRFRAIEQHLEALEHTVRAFAPVVGQVAVADVEIEAAQQDITALKMLARELELSTNNRLRELEADVKSGPAETLKLIAIVVTVFAGLTGAIIAVAQVFG